MSATLLTAALPLLALGFAASALFRLVRMRFPGRAIGLWALPKGPGAVLAFLEILSALFLMIPLTLIWGLFLACALGACHLASLWRMSHPVQT